MSKLGRYTWTGKSGQRYTYTRYSADTQQWPTGSANYICVQVVRNNFYAKYIGETGNLRERLPNHEKWPCCNRNGVSEIHINQDAKSAQQRLNQEADLLAKHDPPCNK